MRLRKKENQKKSDIQYNPGDINNRLPKRPIYFRLFLAAAAIILLLGLGIIIASMIRDKAASTKKYGPTLPGADKIYPAVMYQGSIYRWKQMAGPVTKLPQGELPEGFEYAGDIEYVNTGELTKDFQFTAVFDATGQFYFSKNDPDSVCICITTYWLDQAYVMFTLQ
jgi:hypothetical protein